MVGGKKEAIFDTRIDTRYNNRIDTRIGSRSIKRNCLVLAKTYPLFLVRLVLVQILTLPIHPSTLPPPVALGLFGEGVRRQSLSRSPDQHGKKVQGDRQQAQQEGEQ